MSTRLGITVYFKRTKDLREKVFLYLPTYLLFPMLFIFPGNPNSHLVPFSLVQRNSFSVSWSGVASHKLPFALFCLYLKLYFVFILENICLGYQILDFVLFAFSSLMFHFLLALIIYESNN